MAGCGCLSRGLACKELSPSYNYLSKATSNIFRRARRKRPGRSMFRRSGMPGSLRAIPTRRRGTRRGEHSPGSGAGSFPHSSSLPFRKEEGGSSRGTMLGRSPGAQYFSSRQATGIGIALTRRRAGRRTGSSCVAQRSTPGWPPVRWMQGLCRSASATCFGGGSESSMASACPVRLATGRSPLAWR